MTQSLLATGALVLMVVFPLALTWRHGGRWLEVVTWLVPCALIAFLGLFVLSFPFDVVAVALAALFWITMVTSVRANRMWAKTVVRDPRPEFPILPAAQEQFVVQLGDVVEDVARADFFGGHDSARTVGLLSSGRDRIRSLTAPTPRWASIQTEAIAVIEMTIDSQQFFAAPETESTEELRASLKDRWLALLQDVEKARLST